MADQDIIRHIIREIVTQASGVLKNRRIKSFAHNQLGGGSGEEVDNAPRAIPQAASHNRGDGGVQGEGAESGSPMPANPDSHEGGDSVNGPQPQPPLTPMPQLKHLFTAGIKSHIPQTTVSDTLAAFVVRAVVLDPRNDFRIERELSKEEVQRLITLCVEKITTANSPIMETIKMQVYFDTNFPSQSDYLHREKMSIIASCASVLREITEVKTKNVSVYEPLYRKIVSYIMLRSHVGSPTDMRVIREATAALESVFPQSELSAFINLSRAEKEGQLNGLTQLVTGIRLFNKQLGKGGDAVDNLIELCASELQELTTDIGAQTAETEQLIQLFIAVVDAQAKNPDVKITQSFLERIKDSLVFRRQYLMYLDALQDQLEKTRTELGALGEKFDDAIRDLRSTCKSKTAVPVDQVYPQFISLSSLWTKFMDELFLIAFRRGILDTICYHSKSFEITVPEDVKSLSEPFRKDIEPEMLPESEVVTKASELMAAVAIINKTIEVLHPGNATQYYKLHVEYGGFCPYTLIRRDGVVIPGDKNLGLLRYRDRLFAFVSAEGAREFAKFPDRYMEGVLEMAKKLPDLVQLLHLYSYFPTVDALENAKSFTRQRLMGQMPMVSEAGTQVDTHIVDAKIDSKYQWNEWELRRQALMLVNLKTKKTHSSQTVLSHFRRESEAQHYEPKVQETQTYSNSSTNVPRRVNYLAGLRNDGKPRNKFRVVDLTQY